MMSLAMKLLVKQAISKTQTRYRALFELHLILCKRPSLVTEDKLYLAKLFYKIGISTVSKDAVLKHFNIFVNRYYQTHFEYLYCNVKAYRYHV